jgi:hypothetical protein
MSTSANKLPVSDVSFPESLCDGECSEPLLIVKIVPLSAELDEVYFRLPPFVGTAKNASNQSKTRDRKNLRPEEFVVHRRALQRSL